MITDWIDASWCGYSDDMNTCVHFSDVPVSQMCKLHENRVVEYYCDDDETVICSRCVIMGTHKGHNISSIEDKVSYTLF